MLATQGKHWTIRICNELRNGNLLQFAEIENFSCLKNADENWCTEFLLVIMAFKAICILKSRLMAPKHLKARQDFAISQPIPARLKLIFIHAKYMFWILLSWRLKSTRCLRYCWLFNQTPFFFSSISRYANLRMICSKEICNKNFTPFRDDGLVHRAHFLRVVQLFWGFFPVDEHQQQLEGTLPRDQQEQYETRT